MRIRGFMEQGDWVGDTVAGRRGCGGIGGGEGLGTRMERNLGWEYHMLQQRRKSSVFPASVFGTAGTVERKNQ